MIVAIVPARGGSKSIPRKNIVPVGGKPLITWTLEQAMATERLEHNVWVTTDDDEIRKVASKTTVLTINRPPDTATDIASTESAIRHWFKSCKEVHKATAIVLLQCTSPIRQPNDITEAINVFEESDADSLFSARVVEGYTWRHGPGLCSPMYSQRLPRQAHSVHTLEENGSIYIFRPDVLMEYGTRLGGKVVPYIMHPLDSFQVDEPDDIPLIESLMEVRLANRVAA